MGDQTTAPFSIVVRDTTPPVWTGSVPIQVAATTTSTAGVAVNYAQPTAADPGDVSLPVGVSCTPAPGSVFPVGTTSVSCSASDARGNQTPAAASLSFPVIVTFSAGPPPAGSPTLNVPANMVVEADSPRGAIVRYTVSSSDATPSTIYCDPGPGALFPFGTTTVTCTATRPGGSGTTERSFQVLVRDSKAPVFARAPANIVKKVKKKTRVPVGYKTPVAVDVVDGTVRAVCAPRSGSKFKLGNTKVVCAAVDSRGNRGRTSFRVRVLQIGPLLAPAEGARLASPPLLRWKTVKKAGYYNVQLWKSNRKLLSAWPRSGHLRLHRGWTFGGVERSLAPGLYTWYVWPGYGKKAAADYGKLLGKRTFRITA